tara:strand:- start:35 stop:382 length:348 start_codon:yes stop_codon:yes gene_type:complete
MTKKQDPEILAICDAMLDKKAKDIKILDVRKLTTLTDYFVICTSDSDPQTKAIKENIHENLKKNNLSPLHIEGYEKLNWVLIDYGYIIVQIFTKDTRSYYGIERLWGDAIISVIK